MEINLREVVIVVERVQFFLVQPGVDKYSPISVIKGPYRPVWWTAKAAKFLPRALDKAVRVRPKPKLSAVGFPISTLLRVTQFVEEEGSTERLASEVRRVLCITVRQFCTAVTGLTHGLIQRHLEVTKVLRRCRRLRRGAPGLRRIR